MRRLVLFALLAVGCAPEPVATRAELETLFDDILEKTERREAFSPVKEARLDFSPLDGMRRLREEFVGARTEAELWWALVKLSNARRDRHLSVRPAEGGLAAPGAPALAAPILVLADFADLDRPSFFDAESGDRIVEVNGRTIPEYVAAFRPWIRHSSRHGLYWWMARELPRIVPGVPPELYRETLDLALEDDAGERYERSLAYGDCATHCRELRPEYPGFEPLLERENFHVLRSADDGVVLLRWLDFEFSLIKDVMDLMELAETDELLDHDLVIDVRGSSGGSHGAYAIQRLVNEPFRTTFGNVRISDAGEALIERFAAMEPDGGAPEILGLNLSREWLVEWARTDGRESVRRGYEYTPPTPFKLAHLPRDASGTLDPAPTHFRGRTVILSGPHGGSHLDQFVSMFKDNDLAVVVGMPPGGYSNTWEHEETLVLPGSGRPLATFMWNVGHTLRPNGEILEGNPAMPDVPLPLTRANFRTWDRELLDAALEVLRD